MNKSASKKCSTDKKFAQYLLPAELDRFSTDILNLSGYMVPWATKNGGQAVLAELEQVVTAMDRAKATLNGILNPPPKAPKSPK